MIDFKQAYRTREVAVTPSNDRIASGHIQGAAVHHHLPRRPLTAREARCVAAMLTRLAERAEDAQYGPTRASDGPDGPTGGTPVAAAATG
jgi:hypothetical protein